MQLSEVLDQIGAAATNSELVILVGAGVSRDPPSRLPLWNDLNRSIVANFLLPNIPRSWSNDVLRLSQSLRPEVILQLGIESFGRPILDVLDQLRSINFNPNHSRIISLSRFGNHIITTNLDVLLECAADELGDKLGTYVSEREFLGAVRRGSPGSLFKVHGTISNRQSARNIPSLVASLDQVGSGFSHAKRRALKAVLKQKGLLVVGYYGADHFDLMPLLIESAPALRFAVWVNHSLNVPEVLEEPAGFGGLHPLARQFLERVKERHVVDGRTDIVLAGLAEDPGVVPAKRRPLKRQHYLAPPEGDRSARAALMIGGMCEVIGEPALGSTWLKRFLSENLDNRGRLREELISILGRLLEESGKLDEANIVLSSVNVSRLSPSSRVRHLIRQGNLQNRWGQTSQARSTYNRALREAPVDSALQYASLHALGVPLIFEGRATAAVEHYLSFLPKMYRQGDVRTRLAALNNLGGAFYLAGDSRRAAKWLRLALRDAEFVNYPSRRANILDTLGLAELDYNDPIAAIMYMNQARRIRMRIGNPFEVSFSFVNIGDVLLACGRLEAALRAHHSAYALRTGKLDGREASIPWAGIGRALALLGRREDLENFFDSDVEESNNEIERVRWQLHRSLLLLHLGRDIEAVDLLRSGSFPQRAQAVMADVLLRAVCTRFTTSAPLITKVHWRALGRKRGDRAELFAHLRLIRGQRSKDAQGTVIGDCPQ